MRSYKRLIPHIFYGVFNSDSIIFKHNIKEWSCGSSGSIMSDYGLDNRGSIPDRGRGFFF
jgi:hypothetical protein